jgi:hypothetical protein
MSDVLTVGELLAEFMAERVGQTFSEPGTFLGPYPSGAPAIFTDRKRSPRLIGLMAPKAFTRSARLTGR